VGRDENTERFIKLALYQGRAIKAQKGGFGGTLAKLDPTFITNSYKKNRFYMFSRRMPVDQGAKETGRDMFNESIKSNQV
jgi:peptidylprolyl isomerase domain and WD repeat-containing protein 1